MALADDIRDMAKFSEDRQDVIDSYPYVPPEMIHGCIDCTVSDDIINAYDAYKTKDVVIYTREQFIGSRSVGVISYGGAGATTLTAALAGLAARHSLLDKIAVVDFNEIPCLNLYMGQGVKDIRKAVGLISAEGKSEPYRPPGAERLEIYTGALIPSRRPPIETLKSQLLALGQNYGLLFVDCPSSPEEWSIMEKLDLIILTLRTDVASINCLYLTLPLLQPYANRIKIVLYDVGQTSENETRLALQKIECPFEVIGVIPHDKTVGDTLLLNGYIFDQKCKYMEAAKGIYDVLYPGQIKPQRKRSMFKRA